MVPDLMSLVEIVGWLHGSDPAAVLSRRWDHAPVAARQVLFYVLRADDKLLLKEIARVTDPPLDHSTVCNALARMEARIAEGEGAWTLDGVRAIRSARRRAAARP